MNSMDKPAPLPPPSGIPGSKIPTGLSMEEPLLTELRLFLGDVRRLFHRNGRSRPAPPVAPPAATPPSGAGSD
jgi:hypothetical protein